MYTNYLKRVGRVVSLIFVLSILSLTFLTGCSSEENATSPEVITTSVVSEFDIVRNAVAEYLSAKAGNIKAANLNTMIADGTAPYIVSIRSAGDFAAGHIPGAVNYTFGNLSDVPQDTEVVIYCYTGQSSSFGAAVLGVLNYDIRNLLNGMSSWTSDPGVYKTRFDPATDQGDYEIETIMNEGNRYKYPALDNTSSTSEPDIIKAAVGTVSPKYITNAELNSKITSGEEMTIVSVRSAEQYAVGHIPGAINIGLDNLTENLDKLNPSAPVYVYCYTGHSSAQATALLQMLGFDAYSLKFGMCAWSSDPAINAGACFDASSIADFDIERNE